VSPLIRDLLHECIEPSVAEREFVLRKTIGWAGRNLVKAGGSWTL